MALRALFLLLAGIPVCPDITPKGIANPYIAAEKLGGSFQSKGPEEDRGLKVGVWFNNTLEREERWHCTEAGEWFLRARPGIFVLTGTDVGGWVTKPNDRIVYRDKKWQRITVPKR